MTCSQNCEQGRRCDCTEPKSDLAARLRELSARITETDGTRTKSHIDLRDELEQNLPAILAALEDQQRYRWLRDEYTAAPFNERPALRGDDLTDAIDKARKEGKL